MKKVGPVYLADEQTVWTFTATDGVSPALDEIEASISSLDEKAQEHHP